jgi:hypothetical protein
VASPAAASCAGSTLAAPAAAEIARKLRRLGDDPIDMTILLVGRERTLAERIASLRP